MMQTNSRWWVRLALTIAASTVVWAQGTPAPRTTPQQGTRFTTSIDFVSKDVTPRDAKTGQFLPDLKKEDFTLLEDGVEQKIESFALSHGGRLLTDIEPVAASAPAGIILPSVRPPADTSGRIILIFIDDLHIEFKLTSRMRQLLKRMSDLLIHDGDLYGVVSTGYSSIAQDMTYDRKRIPEIISKVSGAGLKPADLVRAQSTAEGPAEVKYRANTAFSTAYGVLNNFSKITNRRKIFIYMSSGYDFNPFPDARKRLDAQTNSKNGSTDLGLTDPNAPDPSLLSNPFEDQNNEFHQADLVQELSELTRQAKRANVIMYTIDPRGLTAGPDMDETDVLTSEYQDYVRSTQDTLRVIAEQTGGFAVVNQNDFDKALKRIDAEASDYYVLGYYSNNPDPLKRKRTIEIRVNRPGVDLTYTKEYTLKPPPKAIK
jgi:VWFA-related protein